MAKMLDRTSRRFRMAIESYQNIHDSRYPYGYSSASSHNPLLFKAIIQAPRGNPSDDGGRWHANVAAASFSFRQSTASFGKRSGTKAAAALGGVLSDADSDRRLV